MSNKILTLVIAVMAVIIILQRACCGPETITDPGKPVVKTDTVWLKKDSIIIKSVRLVKRDTVYRPGDSVFVPDANYDKLKLQFELLAKNYSVRNIHQDTFLIDSIGKIIISDTVQYNKLKNRRYDLSYKIPVVTKTITHFQTPRRQLYLGGGLSMTTQFQDPTLQLGLLYKNKKDQVFGAYTLWNGNAPQVGASAYWKISFKK